jgi:anti-sigma factor RsiW
MEFSKDHKSRQARKISSLIDGELLPDQARKLAERMADDPSLMRERETVDELDRLLAHWPEPPVCPDVRRAVMARVAADLERSTPENRWRRVWARLGPGQWEQPAWAAAWIFGGIMAGLALWFSAGNRLTEGLRQGSNQGPLLSTAMAGDELIFPSLALSSSAPEESDP